MAVVTNDGLDQLARRYLGILTLSFTLQLRLFQNNFTPGVSSVTADFVECTLAGYAAIALVPSSWTGGTSSGLTQYAYPQQTWTFPAYGGPLQTVYGYYVTETVSGKTLWADVGIPAYTVPLAGGALNLTLSWNDANLS